MALCSRLDGRLLDLAMIVNFSGSKFDGAFSGWSGDSVHICVSHVGASAAPCA